MGKKIGLAGGFSARYGTVTRRQYVEIVTGLRGKHECPRCMFRTVKRWSVGVWHCRKCGYKFAGGAYAPTTKLGEIAARATRGRENATKNEKTRWTTSWRKKGGMVSARLWGGGWWRGWGVGAFLSLWVY